MDEANSTVVEAARPGRFLVDTLPWLKYIPGWFPGASFQRIAAQGRDLMQKSRSVPFQVAKRALVRDPYLS